MSFSLRLKDLREKKGVSQAQLAENLGIGTGSVGMWESTDRIPTSSKLIKLAKFFNVSTDYLLGQDDNENPAAPQLSKNDRELIEAYHTLSPDLQRLLWEQIRLWQRNADAMSAATKKKV